MGLIAWAPISFERGKRKIKTLCSRTICNTQRCALSGQWSGLRTMRSKSSNLLTKTLCDLFPFVQPLVDRLPSTTTGGS